MKHKAMALLSIAAGVMALVILVIPFLGVYLSAVLGPVSILIGTLAYRSSSQGDPLRRTALTGVTLGSTALVILIFFLATGAYSEYAR